MARHQNGWLVYIWLPFDFESGVVKGKGALHCEVDLSHLVLWPDYTDTSKPRALMASGEQVDDYFVDETLITGVEEVTEVFSKLTKNLIDDACLQLRSELLVEGKLLDDEIVVILECLFDGFRYTQIKISRYEQRLLRRISLLKFFNPEI